VRLGLLAGLALFGFAANSLLCRLALRGGQIDAATFTAVRLLSGAAVLALLLQVRTASTRQRRGDWLSAALLFAYAAPFSFAYLQLSAGTGALILFFAVQATMIGADLWRGGRPGAREWLGLGLAFGGLCVLNLPGADAPAPTGVLLMAAAGVAWGVYSLRGRRSGDALAATAGNFLRSLLFAIPLGLLAMDHWAQVEARGIWLATASGALASGCGYALWYAALPGLSRTRAAILQLLVPVLTAALAVALLDEVDTLQLAAGAAAILAGVALAVLRRPR
jgi:drug/metabolite transporter (DMT)-like permease